MIILLICTKKTISYLTNQRLERDQSEFDREVGASLNRYSLRDLLGPSAYRLPFLCSIAVPRFAAPTLVLNLLQKKKNC